MIKFYKKNKLHFLTNNKPSDNLNKFTAFQLKIVMKGTISSYPPRVKDLRGIALAV